MLKPYQKALDWELLPPADVQQLTNLASGEVSSLWIDKDTYRSNRAYQDLLAKKSLFESRGVTTGSSGEPFTVVQSLRSRVIKGWAFNRWLSEIRNGSPLILLWRNKSPSLKQRIEIGLRRLDLVPIYDLANLDLSIFDDEKAELFLKRASNHRNAVLRSYVSVLVWLSHTLGTRLQSLNLRCVIASAETLTAADWDLIERCFGCPCINLYGGTEASPIAASTLDSRNLYIFDDLYKVNVSNGSEGRRIIVTDMINDRMPLVAYDIGDITTGMGQDGVGMYLKDVTGRVSEMVENQNGQSLTSHFIHIIFRDLSEIRRYRVYWLGPGKLKLQLELFSGELGAQARQKIINEFHKNGFSITEFELTPIEQLQGMKHRTVVKL